MLKRITRKFKACFRRPGFERVIDYFPSDSKPKGHVLVSYIPQSLLYGSRDKRFLRHSNVWESLEIVRIFNRNGYVVDAISWDDTEFSASREYRGVFDIHVNLKRCSSSGTFKFLHATGSNPAFSNRAESARIEGLMARRGVAVAPRRAVKESDIALLYDNLEAADAISLIGNGVTASTFPGSIQHKLHRVVPTGSYLSTIRDPHRIKLRKRVSLVQRYRRRPQRTRPGA